MNQRPQMSIVVVLVFVLVVVVGVMSGSATARERSSASQASANVSAASSASTFTIASSVTNGSTLKGTLTWTAVPHGATVQKVDFLIDGGKRWTENYAPYTFNGDPGGVLDTTTLSNGTHTLGVVAYATSGVSATTQVSVNVSNGSQVSTTSPTTPFTITSSIANGSTLKGTLTWTAVPHGATVQKVDFLIDGGKRWTENYAPYTFNGDPGGVLDTTTLSNGTHVLDVIGYAADGRTASTRSTVVTTNTAAGSGVQAYPKAPTDLHLTDSQPTSLTASWTAVTGASGYRIGRDAAALIDIQQTTYTWKGLLCGTQYTLSVQPETSGKDNAGEVATIAVTTAACSLSGGGTGTTTPSPAADTPGSVVFDGGFDSGNISMFSSTPLGGAQCANYGVPSTPSAARGTLQIVGDIAAKGNYSARFDLPAANVANACELLRGRTAAMDDEWYSMEVRFPTGWQDPSPWWGLSLAQLNFQNIWGAPLSVVAHASYVDLVLNSGLCTPVGSAKPACQYMSSPGGNVPMQHLVLTSDFATGVWHQFLIHVKWTNDSDGLVEGYHRLRGQTTWMRTVAFRGYPTLQRTSTFTPVATTRTVDKIGAYRGAAGFPLSIWQDSFCQASSMAAAESCF